jgi:hypothetical protein
MLPLLPVAGTLWLVFQLRRRRTPLENTVPLKGKEEAAEQNPYLVLDRARRLKQCWSDGHVRGRSASRSCADDFGHSVQSAPKVAILSRGVAARRVSRWTGSKPGTRGSGLIMPVSGKAFADERIRFLRNRGRTRKPPAQVGGLIRGHSLGCPPLLGDAAGPVEHKLRQPASQMGALPVPHLPATPTPGLWPRAITLGEAARFAPK